MMKQYFEVKVLLAVALVAVGVVALVGLSGCHGPAPNAAPLIEFVDNGFDYNSVKIGTVVPLEIKVTPGTDDPSTTYTGSWTADPNLGTFAPPDLPNTSWIAPSSITEDPTHVMLQVEVETAYGFKNRAVKVVTVRNPPVTPQP